MCVLGGRATYAVFTSPFVPFDPFDKLKVRAQGEAEELDPLLLMLRFKRGTLICYGPIQVGHPEGMTEKLAWSTK